MKKIISLSCFIFLVLIFITGCKNQAGQKESPEINKETVKNKFDLSTQEGYEGFLADWGISIPENATLKELKKTNDGNYKLIYSLEPFENLQDSLQNTYEKLFDEILLKTGWEKQKEGWDPHGTTYKNESNYFKFFILVSEKYNVYELAFKYGE